MLVAAVLLADLQQDLPLAADLEQEADLAQPALAGSAVLLTAVAVAVLLAAALDLQQEVPLAADFEQEADLAQPALAGSPLVAVAVAVDFEQLVLVASLLAALAACGHCAEDIPIATNANITNIINTFFMAVEVGFDY